LGYVIFFLCGVIFSLLFPIVAGVIVGGVIGAVARPSSNITKVLITPIVCGALGGLGFWLSAYIALTNFEVNRIAMLLCAVAMSFVMVNENVHNRKVFLGSQLASIVLLFMWGL